MTINVLPLLSNFSLDHPFTQTIHRSFNEQLNRDPYRRAYQSFLAEIPPEQDGQEVTCSHTDYNQLVRICIEAKQENIELELMLLTLDRKLSLIAQHIREPWQGFFEQMGITPDYQLLRPRVGRQKPNLKLVKR